MEWQTVQHKRGRRRYGEASNPEVTKLARELRNALLPRPRQNGGTRSRPEWKCECCQTMNFMDRVCCRRCGGVPPAPRPAPPKENRAGGGINNAAGAYGLGLPPGSVWENIKGSKRTSAKTLEQSLKVVRSHGVSEESVASIAAEAEAIRKDRRSIGARLDSAKARATRAQGQMTKAETAVQAALERRDLAEKELQKAQADLVDLENEVATTRARCLNGTLAPQHPLQGIINGAQSLLQKLESNWIVQVGQNEAPEAVLTAMRDLHAAIAEAVPEPELSMSLSGQEEDALSTAMHEEPKEEDAVKAETSSKRAFEECQSIEDLMTYINGNDMDADSL